MYRKTKQLELYRIFPHTRVGARRTGGFRVTGDDVREKITKAMHCYWEITGSCVKTVDCCEENDCNGLPDTICEDEGTMYHIGGGVYCDDDGDNWSFF